MNAPASKHIPQPGDVLAGKYEVEHVLGQGGMGVVVAARHQQLDQRVALKFLLPEAIAHPGVVDRFAREAKAAARIKGEHVARVIDVGEMDGGVPYMVLEYLEGKDLGALLASDGPFAPEDAVRYVLETCEALAEAHAAGIVHRDLKPANLFLAQQPGQRAIIKVLDFGISKMVEPAKALTQTATVLGTAFYMSPEQLTSPKTVDARSDIWALGVILYELTTGKIPYEGETVPEVIGSILSNVPAAPSTHRPDLPPALEKVILRCLKSKREDRFENVAELAAALSPLAAARDRVSIELVSRVLGVPVPDPKMVSAAPPPAVTARPPARDKPAAEAPATTKEGPTRTTQAMDAPQTALSPGVARAPATSLALASTPPPRELEAEKKRAPAWIFAVAGLVVVGGIGAAVMARSGDPKTPAASPDPTIATPTDQVPSLLTPPSTAPELAPPPSALATAPSAAPSAAPSEEPPKPAVAVKGHAHVPAASTAKPLASAPTTVKSAAPPPTVTAQPTAAPTNSNKLHIQLK